MKKIFTLAAFLLATMSMQAKNYTCPLVVTQNGTTTGNEANVTVDVTEQSGKYTLTLQNITFGGETVASIVVTDAEATLIGNTTIIKANKNVEIPELGTVPVIMQGELKADAFNGILNLAMGDMNVSIHIGQKVNEMGQLPNSGFEEFHKAKNDLEPNGWHTFGSATGSLASSANANQHVWSDTDVRDNAETGSKKSVKIASYYINAWVVKASANGTITTGRLNAGAANAKDSKNNSFIDITSTDLDANNDPFYAVMNNKPDAMKVWVKYQAGKSNKNPYATISALLTDGNKVQDPELDANKEYVIARAGTTSISNDKKWTPINLPFTYDSETAIPKTLLVTMSTCAVPGGGSTSNSDKDILWVDDVELVYNHAITSIKYGNQSLQDNAELTLDAAPSLDNLAVTSDGVGAYITKSLVYNAHDNYSGIIYITVTSNDLKNATTAKIRFTIKGKDKQTETFKTQDYGWATYTPYIPVQFPTSEGIKAYTVNYANGNVQTTEINGIAPAGTPLLLRAKTQEAKEYTLTGTDDAPTSVSTSLRVAQGDGSEWKANANIYVLSNGTQGIGFYKLASDTKIPKDKCYIAVDQMSYAASFLSLDGSDSGTTAIDHIENAADANAAQSLYNLAGQKVNAQYKGIVIKGGKKMVIK